MSTPQSLAPVTKQKILHKLESQRQALKALHVQRIGLFGSYLRGDQSDDSDIDLLVEFATGQKSFDNFMALAFALDELFQQKVELVTPASLSPTMRSFILEDIEYVEIDS